VFLSETAYTCLHEVSMFAQGRKRILYHPSTNQIVNQLIAWTVCKLHIR
jgi:hypothetical protein